MTTNTSRQDQLIGRVGVRLALVVVLSGASVALSGVAALAAPDAPPSDDVVVSGVDPSVPSDQSGDVDAAVANRRAGLGSGAWTVGLRNRFGEVVTGAESQFWLDGPDAVGGGTVAEVRWDFGAPNADGFQAVTTTELGTPDAPAVLHVYELAGPVVVSATVVVDAPASTATPAARAAACGPVPNPANGDGWAAWGEPLDCPAPLVPVCSVGDALIPPVRDAIGNITQPVTCQGGNVAVPPQRVETVVTVELSAVSFKVSGVDTDGLGGAFGATPGPGSARPNGSTGVSGIEYTVAVADVAGSPDLPDGYQISNGTADPAVSSGSAESSGSAASSGETVSSGEVPTLVGSAGGPGAPGSSGLPAGLTVLLANGQAVSGDPRTNRATIVVGNRAIDMNELGVLLGRDLNATAAVGLSDDELIASIVGFDWNPADGGYTPPVLTVAQLEALARRSGTTDEFIAQLARALNVEVAFVRRQIAMKGNGKGVWGGSYQVGVPGVAAQERRGLNSNSYKKVSFRGRLAARNRGQAAALRTKFATAREENALLDLLATMLQGGQHNRSDRAIENVLRELATALDPTSAAGIDVTTNTLIGERIVGDWRDDKVTLYGDTQNAVVELGAGSNTLEVIDGIVANTQIALGAFDDIVTMTNVQLSGTTITLGQGTDTLQVAGTVTGTRFEQGDGAATVDLVGIIDSTTIDLGDSNDTLNVTGEVTGTRILTGSGDDVFTLIARATNVTTELGDGDDTFRVTGVGNGLTVDLGEGVDTVVIDAGFTGTIVINDPKHGWVKKRDVRDQDRVILYGDGWVPGDGATPTFLRRTASGAETARVVLGSDNVEMVTTESGEVLLDRKPKPPRRSWFSRILSWIAPIAAIAGLFFPPLLVVAGIASTAQAVIAGCALCAFAAFANVVPGGAWISRAISAVQGVTNNNWISGLTGLVPGITAKVGAFVENIIDKQPLRAIASGASVIGHTVGGSDGATIATVGNGINNIGQFIQTPNLDTASSAITGAVNGVRNIANEQRRETFVSTDSPLSGPKGTTGPAVRSSDDDKALRTLLTPGAGAGAPADDAPEPGQPRTLEQLQNGVLRERLSPEQAREKLDRLQSTIPDGNELTVRLGPGATPSDVLERLQSTVPRRTLPVPDAPISYDDDAGLGRGGSMVLPAPGPAVPSFTIPTLGAAVRGLAPVVGKVGGALISFPAAVVLTTVAVGVTLELGARELRRMDALLEAGDIAGFYDFIARNGSEQEALDFAAVAATVQRLARTDAPKAIAILEETLAGRGENIAARLAIAAVWAHNGVENYSQWLLEVARRSPSSSISQAPPATAAPQATPAPVTSAPERDLNAEDGLRAIVNGGYANSQEAADIAFAWLYESYNNGSISEGDLVVASRYQVVQRANSIIAAYTGLVEQGEVVTQPMIDYFNSQVVDVSNYIQSQFGYEILSREQYDIYDEVLTNLFRTPRMPAPTQPRTRRRNGPSSNAGPRPTRRGAAPPAATENGGSGEAGDSRRPEPPQQPGGDRPGPVPIDDLIRLGRDEPQTDQPTTTTPEALGDEPRVRPPTAPSDPAPLPDGFPLPDTYDPNREIQFPNFGNPILPGVTPSEPGDTRPTDPSPEFVSPDPRERAPGDRPNPWFIWRPDKFKPKDDGKLPLYGTPYRLTPPPGGGTPIVPGRPYDSDPFGPDVDPGPQDSPPNEITATASNDDAESYRRSLAELTEQATEVDGQIGQFERQYHGLTSDIDQLQERIDELTDRRNRTTADRRRDVSMLESERVRLEELEERLTNLGYQAAAGESVENELTTAGRNYNRSSELVEQIEDRIADSSTADNFSVANLEVLREEQNWLRTVRSEIDAALEGRRQTAQAIEFGRANAENRLNLTLSNPVTQAERSRQLRFDQEVRTDAANREQETAEERNARFQSNLIFASWTSGLLGVGLGLGLSVPGFFEARTDQGKAIDALNSEAVEVLEEISRGPRSPQFSETPATIDGQTIDEFIAGKLREGYMAAEVFDEIRREFGPAGLSELVESPREDLLESYEAARNDYQVALDQYRDRVGDFQVPEVDPRDLPDRSSIEQAIESQSNQSDNLGRSRQAQQIGEASRRAQAEEIRRNIALTYYGGWSALQNPYRPESADQMLRVGDLFLQTGDRFDGAYSPERVYEEYQENRQRVLDSGFEPADVDQVLPDFSREEIESQVGGQRQSSNAGGDPNGGFPFDLVAALAALGMVRTPRGSSSGDDDGSPEERARRREAQDRLERIDGDIPPLPNSDDPEVLRQYVADQEFETRRAAIREANAQKAKKSLTLMQRIGLGMTIVGGVGTVGSLAYTIPGALVRRGTTRVNERTADISAVEQLVDAASSPAAEIIGGANGQRIQKEIYNRLEAGNDPSDLLAELERRPELGNLLNPAAELAQRQDELRENIVKLQNGTIAADDFARLLRGAGAALEQEGVELSRSALQAAIEDGERVLAQIDVDRPNDFNRVVGENYNDQDASTYRRVQVYGYDIPTTNRDGQALSTGEIRDVLELLLNNSALLPPRGVTVDQFIERAIDEVESVRPALREPTYIPPPEPYPDYTIPDPPGTRPPAPATPAPTPTTPSPSSPPPSPSPVPTESPDREGIFELEGPAPDGVRPPGDSEGSELGPNQGGGGPLVGTKANSSIYDGPPVPESQPTAPEDFLPVPNVDIPVFDRDEPLPPLPPAADEDPQDPDDESGIPIEVINVDTVSPAGRLLVPSAPIPTFDQSDPGSLPPSPPRSYSIGEVLEILQDDPDYFSTSSPRTAPPASTDTSSSSTPVWPTVAQPTRTSTVGAPWTLTISEVLERLEAGETPAEISASIRAAAAATPVLETPAAETPAEPTQYAPEDIFSRVELERLAADERAREGRTNPTSIVPVPEARIPLFDDDAGLPGPPPAP